MSDHLFPLPPADQMPTGLDGEISVIRPSALLPGDVILSTAKGVESWLIRTATLSTFSHTGLHLGHGVAIEASDPGVVPIFLPVIGHAASTRLAVKRMPDLTPAQREELVGHALDLLYRPYSIRGAVGTIVSQLRKLADPGRFCSQLVAECYSMIGRPLCSNKAPEACTPNDIANSAVLKPVTNGVKQMETLVHAAIVSPYAARYAAYLQSIVKSERVVIAKAEACFSAKLPEPNFNIFDLARQVTDPSLPEADRKMWDAQLANVIEDHVQTSPLLPCPGLSVATFLFTPVPLPLANSWAWAVVASTDGREAFTEKVKDTYAAYTWESARWRREAARLAEVAEETGLESHFALAAWMDHAATIRSMYRELCASSTNPGSLPRERKSEIKRLLRSLRNQDPAGAEEFSFDPWMLLDQDVG